MMPRIGSPPQVRGKPYDLANGRLPNRITPAGAGKTSSSKRASSIRADHPRRCGENAMGSAPEHAVFGITPAGAGKTGIGSEYPVIHWDHPRRCGENSADYQTH